MVDFFGRNAPASHVQDLGCMQECTSHVKGWEQRHVSLVVAKRRREILWKHLREPRGPPPFFGLCNPVAKEKAWQEAVFSLWKRPEPTNYNRIGLFGA